MFKRVTMSIEQPLEKPTGDIFYISTELPGFAGIISEVCFWMLHFQKSILEVLKLLFQLNDTFLGPTGATPKRIWNNVSHILKDSK